jgi:hypothetical protein
MSLEVTRNDVEKDWSDMMQTLRPDGQGLALELTEYKRKCPEYGR